MGFSQKLGFFYVEKYLGEKWSFCSCTCSLIRKDKEQIAPIWGWNVKRMSTGCQVCVVPYLGLYGILSPWYHLLFQLSQSGKCAINRTFLAVKNTPDISVRRVSHFTYSPTLSGPTSFFPSGYPCCFSSACIMNESHCQLTESHRLVCKECKMYGRPKRIVNQKVLKWQNTKVSKKKTKRLEDWKRCPFVVFHFLLLFRRF